MKAMQAVQAMHEPRAYVSKTDFMQSPDQSTGLSKRPSVALLRSKKSMKADNDPTLLEGERRAIDFMYASCQDQKCCDLLVKASGGDIYAHSVAFGAYSDTLAGSFYGYNNGEMITLDLTEYRREVVLTILHFLYITELQLNRHVIGQVLSCVTKLGMEFLVEKCMEYLKYVSVDNAVLHYSKAESNNMQDLRDKLLEFILENFCEVYLSKHFVYLPLERLISILKHQNLKVTEEAVVFRAVVRWVDHDRAARIGNSMELLKCVRFQLISAEVLASEVEGDADPHGGLQARHSVVSQHRSISQLHLKMPQSSTWGSSTQANPARSLHQLPHGYKDLDVQQHQMAEGPGKSPRTSELHKHMPQLQPRSVSDMTYQQALKQKSPIYRGGAKPKGKKKKNVVPQRPEFLKNFVELENPGEGSCLYYALSQAIYDDLDHHNELREEAVAYVVERWSTLGPGAVDSNEMPYRDEDHYTSDMLQYATQGTGMELEALGALHNLRVRFHDDSGYLYTIHETNPIEINIYLSGDTWGGGHFSLLIPIDSLSPPCVPPAQKSSKRKSSTPELPTSDKKKKKQ